MKFRTLKNWENPTELEGLVFFAQLLEELLFDYSLDTYKPSAMNSCTLCLEALSLIKDIESEIIDKSNLSHVLEELVLNLKKDEVVGKLLDIDLSTATARLLNKDVTVNEKKTIVELIHYQIYEEVYKETTEELLIEAVKNGREKNRIRSLTRSYITTLINMGYSTRYLYPTARKFFYWSDQIMRSSDDIKKFFNLVSGEEIEYKAVFKASLIFKEIEDSCTDFKITIGDTLDEKLSEYAESKNFEIDENGTYLLVDSISALDVYSARDEAERKIERLSTLTNLFHHKEVPYWEEKALLINVNTETPRLVPSSQNPMLMCSDLRTKEAAIHLNSFIKDFSLREMHSFQKFTRAAELHALALRSDSPENQLLNLWIGLETLTPSKLASNKAKINNIIDSILPFLSLHYIYSLTDRLVQDFKIWNRSELNKALEGIEGDNERHKLIKLLVLKENDDKKRLLFKALGDFHLLRNRAHYFSECLSSTGKVDNILKNHWKRVDWQIRRIYRTRNQIVHAGRTPSYINVLIKNVHDYLDIVTHDIANLASEGNKINTIDQAYKYVDIIHSDYLKSLQDSDIKIDASNINSLIIEKKI